MHFEDLGRLWREQAGAAVAPELGAALRDRALELDRLVRLRDRLETLVALAILPVFAYVTVAGRFDISRVGAAILTLACLITPIKLRRARRPPLDPTLPLLASMRSELDRVRAQRRLLETVLWWYLAPLAIGVALFLAGPLAKSWQLALLVVGVALVFVRLWQLNRRVIRDQLEPRERELEEWIAGLQSERWI